MRNADSAEVERYLMICRVSIHVSALPLMVWFMIAIQFHVSTAMAQSATQATTQAADDATLRRELSQLSDQWHREADPLGKSTKSVWEQRQRILHRLFDNADPGLKADLVRYVSARGENNDTSDRFYLFLKDEVVDFLITEGNREDLVNLLATHCPDCVYFHSVEFYLVFYGDGRFPASPGRIKDPLLVFCEAFDRCTDPQNRAKLAHVLRRAFLLVKWPDKTDEDLVRHARSWYAENKGAIEPNEDYAQHDRDYPNMLDERVPLFVPIKR
jgi:hypothetical protein